jgi:hypothetical protein
MPISHRFALLNFSTSMLLDTVAGHQGGPAFSLLAGSEAAVVRVVFTGIETSNSFRSNFSMITEFAIPRLWQ